MFFRFIFVALFFFIDNFISFYHRKNFSLQFYTINNSAEKIILNKTFAYAIDCDDETKTTEANNNYFNIDINFTYLTKDNVKAVEKQNCTYFDFGFNFFNTMKNLEIHDLTIKNFSCIKNNENEIEGIYTDENFSFYKITIESKGNDNIEDINDFLLNNECKLQFYYKDYILMTENYRNPFKPILNSLFIQMNPDFEIKKNVYFMKYVLNDEDKLIDISNLKKNDESKDETEIIGFSRTADYFIYRTSDLEKANATSSDSNKTNATSSDSNESKKYATLYIRSDNRKTIVNRKYQNLLDFYAENTSFWFGIFEFLNIFFTVYNGFHANLSMSKKLFFFDDKEDNKYNILRKNSINSNKSIFRKNTLNNTNKKIEQVHKINDIINVNYIDEISINNDSNDNNNDNDDNKNNNDNNDNNDKNIKAGPYIYSKNYNNYIIPSEKHLSSEEVPNISKKSTIQIDENENKNPINLFEIIKISFFTCCQ